MEKVGNFYFTIRVDTLFFKGCDWLKMGHISVTFLIGTAKGHSLQMGNFFKKFTHIFTVKAEVDKNENLFFQFYYLTMV